MKISFVIPCYRSEHTLEMVVAEIIDTLAIRSITDYEIILVNDCSPDNVWDVIKRLAMNNSRIKGIFLARNFGQHSALMAGYEECTGDYVVSLDDDGQTPISQLYELLDKLQEGYDVVYAFFANKHKKLYREIGTYIATKMTEKLIGMPKGNRGSSFFVMRRFVLNEILRYKNAYPFLPGLVFRTTKNVSCVPVKKRKRIEGESGYSLMSLIGLFMNGVTAFSVKPLEISAYIGFIMAMIGFIYAVVVVVRKAIGNTVVLGWSSLIATFLFIGGMILISLGLIGEYIGRIYISLNNSPQYVVKERVGADSESNTMSVNSLT